MKMILAIDQSTSATKALLFDSAAHLVDSASRDHQQHYPQPGWVEHDAEEIWQNTRHVVADVVGRQRARVDDIAGIALTNQRETFVVIDRATGVPLHPAIVWQCRRGAEICDTLREQGHEEQVSARTGLKLDTYFSASKLAWLIQQRTDIASRLADGSALFGTIDTYLLYRMTSGQVFATDSTNASRTLLMDLATRRWDAELCRLFGVPTAALPEIRDATAHFGSTNFGGVLPRLLPICGVIGDSQAALLAQRCFHAGDIKATLGTGTSVLLNVGSECRSPISGTVAALAWSHQAVPTYAWEGIINTSAATLLWLRDQLGLITSLDEVEPLAASVPDNGGVYLVPAFAGLGAPHWRPTARAAIVGMTAFTRREHIVRAALESIALQISDIIAMFSAAGTPSRRLQVDGGPSRNALLLQMLADATQLTVEASRVANMSALGAAMAGLLGLGLKSLDDLNLLELATTRAQPRMSLAAAQAWRAEWHASVQRVY